MNVYQFNPAKFNTNTEVGEVVFICTYIKFSCFIESICSWTFACQML